jgi:branched-chain amino acid transport system ATP-binding protein
VKGGGEVGGGPEARSQQSTPLLEVRDLTVHHGQLRALDRVSLRVFPGEVYAIIGANGAGKSTLLRTIAGLHRPTDGAILYDGKDMTKIRPERRATGGIVMVPEGRRLFGSLTVEENLKVGATYARKGPWTIERVYEIFAWMKDRRTQRTAQLSGGEQQAVAIGRALVANPRVLLLDELSLGLAPVIVQRIYAMLPQILSTGLTVLLVEQDVSQALRVASHIQCLLEGHTTLEGRPSEVTAEQVEAAYFGLPGGNGGAGSPPVSRGGLGGIVPPEGKGLGIDPPEAMPREADDLPLGLGLREVHSACLLSGQAEHSFGHDGQQDLGSAARDAQAAAEQELADRASGGPVGRRAFRAVEVERGLGDILAVGHSQEFADSGEIAVIRSAQLGKCQPEVQ